MRRHRLLSLMSVSALMLMFAGLLLGQSTTTAQDKKAARPSEPAEIQEVQEVTAVGASHSPTIADWIGKLHPALVHFPIGWMVLLLLVEMVATATGREEWARAGFLLLAGLLASLLPALATGFLRASSMGMDPEVLELMTTHRNLNIAAGMLCLLSFVLRYAWRYNFGTARRRLHICLLACAALLMLLAGHLGGKMVFGKDYLPF